ncbi:MAG: sensor histidine kinase [Blastocatellia bacterium]
MRLRLSLLTRIMFWFFLNLLVLGVAWVVFLSVESLRNPEAPRAWLPPPRVEAVARVLSAELHEKTTAERERILRNFSDAWQVEFWLYAHNGEKVAGPAPDIPAEVARLVATRPAPPPGAPPPNAMDPPRRPGRPFPVETMRTSNPRRYWAIVRVPIFDAGSHADRRGAIVAASDSMSGNGLFFDPWPWGLGALAVFGISLLLWLPFVRNLTRAISQMTRAAEQIAEEHFDVRVDEHGTDELGRLGRAINHLAARLSGFVGGQKRFLGDISHELNSPLARMQFALGILDDRVDPAHRQYVNDAQEEVQLMAGLVSELLAYSRAGLKSATVELAPVPLRALAEKVVAREGGGAEIEIGIAETIAVMAHEELLARALGNLTRNAVRYAGAHGAIRISAVHEKDQVRICVTDQGPGVPAEALPRLFDPFFRLEADRARDTGGAGLGLAIVKTCLEACQGTVSARNREPGGLEFTITLAAAR